MARAPPHPALRLARTHRVAATLRARSRRRRSVRSSATQRRRRGRVRGTPAITLWRLRRTARAGYRVLPASLHILNDAIVWVPHPSHHSCAVPERTVRVVNATPSRCDGQALASTGSRSVARRSRSRAPHPRSTPSVGRTGRATARSRTHLTGKAAGPRRPQRLLRTHRTPYSTCHSMSTGKLVGPSGGWWEGWGTKEAGNLRDPIVLELESHAFPPSVDVRVRSGTRAHPFWAATVRAHRCGRGRQEVAAPVASSGEDVGLAVDDDLDRGIQGARRDADGGLGPGSDTLPAHTTSAGGAFVLLVRLGSFITILFRGDRRSRPGRMTVVELGSDGDRGGSGRGPRREGDGTDVGRLRDRAGSAGDRNGGNGVLGVRGSPSMW